VTLARVLVALVVAAACGRHAPERPAARLPAIRFIDVAPDVRLEVVDWGGTGRDVVLLSGLGGTAHDFDTFAPKLASTYHVYGITRRGFGGSTLAKSGYDADRLGDDVLAVLDSLKLTRPVLVGHSIAGEELSSIGSRRPERVAGLVYLDAAYTYAYHDSATLAIENRLRAFSGPPPAHPNYGPYGAVAESIFAGAHHYTRIGAPALAIFALGEPPSTSDIPPEKLAAFRALALEYVRSQADAFERGVPGARVVRVPGATHWVYRSNEGDVLRETRAFVEGLP
jgi:non-heme chloroperoxidase